jgi:hypothetical protein
MALYIFFNVWHATRGEEITGKAVIFKTSDSESRVGRRGITPKRSFEHPKSADHHCDRNGLASAVGYRSRVVDPGNRF